MTRPDCSGVVDADPVELVGDERELLLVLVRAVLAIVVETLDGLENRRAERRVARRVGREARRAVLLAHVVRLRRTEREPAGVGVGVQDAMPLS